MSPSRFLAALLCAAAAVAASSTARANDDPYAALLAPSGACGAAADELNLDQAAAQQAMLCLTNYARARSSLAPLQLRGALNQAAQAKLAADVRCRQFSHTPCGAPFASVFARYLAGANGYEVGENIAWGTGTYGTPRQAMNGWLHSSGHRENILTGAYHDIGIGYLPGQTFQGYGGATLWSQEFGARTPASTRWQRRHRRR